MPSKKRGGLSQREYNKTNAVLKPVGKTSPVLSDTQAKKATSSSISKESKSLASAQKEYISSLTPSGDETAALKANQDILMGQEQQANKITNTQGAQGNAIPLSLIGGQVERLNRDTETKTIPLKYQIAALQSQREARGNVAQAKYKGVTESYNRKVTASKAKTVDPLDTEYKTLRNERAQLAITKSGRGKSVNAGADEKKAGWGSWTEKQVADEGDILGRKKKTIMQRINGVTGEKQTK